MNENGRLFFIFNFKLTDALKYLQKSKRINVLKRNGQRYAPGKELRNYSPISSLMSSSTVPIPAMPNISTKTFATFGLKKAGSVGPK